MQACVSYVKTRINTEASIVLGAVLDLSGRPETRLLAEKSRKGAMFLYLHGILFCIIELRLSPASTLRSTNIFNSSLSFQYT